MAAVLKRIDDSNPLRVEGDAFPAPACGIRPIVSNPLRVEGDAIYTKPLAKFQKVSNPLRLEGDWKKTLPTVPPLIAFLIHYGWRETKR